MKRIMLISILAVTFLIVAACVPYTPALTPDAQPSDSEEDRHSSSDGDSSSSQSSAPRPTATPPPVTQEECNAWEAKQSGLNFSIFEIPNRTPNMQVHTEISAPGATSLKVYLNGQVIGESSESWSGAISISEDGDHLIEAEARGTIGPPSGRLSVCGTFSQKAYASGRVVVDTSPPIIKELTPVVDVTYNRLLISGTVEDTSGIEQIIVGEIGQTVSTDDDGWFVTSVSPLNKLIWRGTVPIILMDKLGNIAQQSVSVPMPGFMAVHYNKFDQRLKTEISPGFHPHNDLLVKLFGMTKGEYWVIYQDGYLPEQIQITWWQWGIRFLAAAPIWGSLIYFVAIPLVKWVERKREENNLKHDIQMARLDFAKRFQEAQFRSQLGETAQSKEPAWNIDRRTAVKALLAGDREQQSALGKLMREGGMPITRETIEKVGLTEQERILIATLFKIVAERKEVQCIPED